MGECGLVLSKTDRVSGRGQAITKSAHDRASPDYPAATTTSAGPVSFDVSTLALSGGVGVFLFERDVFLRIAVTHRSERITILAVVTTANLADRIPVFTGCPLIPFFDYCCGRRSPVLAPKLSLFQIGTHQDFLRKFPYRLSLVRGQVARVACSFSGSSGAPNNSELAHLNLRWRQAEIKIGNSERQNLEAPHGRDRRARDDLCSQINVVPEPS